MPEGDTLFRIRAALAPVLEGQRAQVSLPHADITHEPVHVQRVHVHGKNLLVVFADGRSVYTHLRMQGSWHVYLADQPWHRPKWRANVVIETEKHIGACFDVPKAVLLSALKTRRFLASLDAHTDILSDTFEPEAAAQRLCSAGTTPIAVALLDQSILAGIGNVYKSEALFACNINPSQTCDVLAFDDALRLVTTAQAMMRRNVVSIEHGTPSAHYRYQRTTQSGCEVGKGPIAVYGRHERGCYRCGTAISMIRQGDLLRSTYFCPRCQR